MLIEPQEFLERALRLGIERSLFKAHMVIITNDADGLEKMLATGKVAYFAYDDGHTYLRFTFLLPENLPELPNETYAEAFKVLRLIAE